MLKTTRLSTRASSIWIIARDCRRYTTPSSTTTQWQSGVSWPTSVWTTTIQRMRLLLHRMPRSFSDIKILQMLSMNPSESNFKPKRRCSLLGCHRKIGSFSVACRCGLCFCSEHRLFSSHNCQFDYKTYERQKLTAANPLVEADRVR